MDDVCVSFFGQEILMVLPSGRWQFQRLGGRFFFDSNSDHQDATTYMFSKGIFEAKPSFCHWNPGRGKKWL